jgi:multicomponent Na+:H+ antiporter subunit F
VSELDTQFSVGGQGNLAGRERVRRIEMRHEFLNGTANPPTCRHGLRAGKGTIVALVITSHPLAQGLGSRREFFLGTFPGAFNDGGIALEGDVQLTKGKGAPRFERIFEPTHSHRSSIAFSGRLTSVQAGSERARARYPQTTSPFAQFALSAVITLTGHGALHSVTRMTLLLYGFALFLLLNLAAGLVRVLRGPTDADRMLAAQLFGTTGVGILIVLAEAQEMAALRDVALVFALLAALATAAFVRARGRRLEARE